MKAIASISLVITLIVAFGFISAIVGASDDGFRPSVLALLPTLLLMLLNIILAVQVLRGRSAFIKGVSITNLFLLFIFLIIIAREVIADGYTGGRDILANLLTVLYFAGNAYLYPLMKKRDALALQRKTPDIFN